MMQRKVGNILYLLARLFYYILIKVLGFFGGLIVAFTLLFYFFPLFILEPCAYWNMSYSFVNALNSFDSNTAMYADGETFLGVLDNCRELEHSRRITRLFLNFETTVVLSLVVGACETITNADLHEHALQILCTLLEFANALPFEGWYRLFERIVVKLAPLIWAYTSAAVSGGSCNDVTLEILLNFAFVYLGIPIDVPDAIQVFRTLREIFEWMSQHAHTNEGLENLPEPVEIVRYENFIRELLGLHKKITEALPVPDR